MGMANFELFDFEYPIVDSVWKKEFEELFVDYYYFYEIGSETIDRWKHTLMSRLRLIMPYYNELYLSTLFDIDPLLTQKIIESGTDGKRTKGSNVSRNQSTGSDTSTTGADTVNNAERTDYPQTTDISTDIPTERTKSTGGTDTESQSSTTQLVEGSHNTDIGTDGEYSKEILGYIGNQNELLRSYRDNIININNLIIQDLKRLFILVY